MVAVSNRIINSSRTAMPGYLVVCQADFEKYHLSEKSCSQPVEVIWLIIFPLKER